LQSMLEVAGVMSVSQSVSQARTVPENVSILYSEQ